MSHTDKFAKHSPLSADSQLSVPDYETAFRKFHHTLLNESANTIGSNDSSPISTISTVDDSSATETSPGSSPESPPPTTFAVGMLRPRTADDSNGAFFELQKQPPPRKGRNLKNLAVNTSRNPVRAASTTSLPLEAQHDLDASVLSPSFVKPPTPPRRRPSNLGLTLLTPGGTKPAPREVRLTIPSTPAFGRPGTLRHFQSSPSLPLVTGAGLSHLSNGQSAFQHPTLDTILSPVEPKDETPIEEEEEEEQNFDIPLSREEKPEAYPDGPICVYDPNIDLYLEPTADQAMEYDVIMNVASEVRNPFLQHVESTSQEPQLRLDGGGGIQYAPKRLNTVTPNVTDVSAQDSSPTTPKATPLEAQFPEAIPSNTQTKEPEYIHVPWEHNSDIVPDLLRLVKLIDEKVVQGKRVLVHCQCGVSRSASLVVAYGLYKNPALSVQEAYDAVKKRSKWIGPNMNLIMQLQEFRSSLERGGLLTGNRGFAMTPSSAISEWNGPFADPASSLSKRDEPLSAVVGPAAQRQPATSLGAISPGPSSAPSGFSWPIKPTQRVRSISAVKPATAYVDPSGHVVPFLKVIDADRMRSRPAALKKSVSEDIRSPVSTEPSLQSPRATEFSMAPLRPAQEVDPADKFGLMSPTSTELAGNPFDRSALLASIGMGSMRADEETPRRSQSLKNRESWLGTDPNGKAPRRLKGKISSPNLREQRQLQTLQAKIEASLPVRTGHSPHTGSMDDALMSPRATEFTTNPFALPLPTSTNTTDNATTRSSSGADPRSPAHKGQDPITRNIWDVL